MQHSQSALLILVLDGVHSGRSSYARKIAKSARRVTFVAFAIRCEDAEMHAKIERHRADRPQSWATVEEPVCLSQTVHKEGRKADVTLNDCSTLFAFNLLESCGSDCTQLRAHIDELCSALRAAPYSVILVSNEIGNGVVPAYEVGRRFRHLVDGLNQRVASVADTVSLMIAGLPFALEGCLTAEISA